MRVLLLIVFVNGVVPALGEAVENVSHYARTEHVAHCAENAGAPCDSSRERGCTDTEHHCVCCAGMPVVQVPRAMAGVLPEQPAGVFPASVSSPNARSLEPPFRPPIV